MALARYNGFTPESRERSQVWLNAQFAAGLARPTRCDACGQTKGAIDYHTEDYSEPFGPHIHAHKLCYRCHLTLHCKRRFAPAWAEYRRLIRQGYRFPGMPRAFGQIGPFLADVANWPDMVVKVRAPMAESLLDVLESGFFNPNHETQPSQACPTPSKAENG